MKTAIVNLPFEGFYESRYSEGIDHEESSWCEYRAEESNDSDDDESRHPEELRLSADELAELLFSATDYSAAYDKVARMYVDAFDYAAGELLGLTVADVRKRAEWSIVDAKAPLTWIEESYRRDSLRMTFESMDSPREYNFATDRVYAEMPLAVLYLLFRRSRAESHATLARVIGERFTSYDGFLSHYPNHIDSWLAKPLADWDHNELGTLLIAALAMTPDFNERDFGWQIYESVSEDGGFMQAWDSAVDWPKFEAKREEARDDKRDALAAENPELAAEIAARTPRCSDTPDMFA